MFGVAAQNNASPRVQNLIAKADDYRAHFLFSKAVTHYKKVLSYKEDNYDAMIGLADCYYKMADYSNALFWYDSASRHRELSASHGLQYVNALLHTGESASAKLWLEKYLQMHPDDNQAREKLSGIEAYAEFFKDSARYQVTNMPINSDQAEFSPVLYDDGIIVVATQNNNKYLDLVYYDTKKLQAAPRSLGESVNSDLHEGPATLYDNGTKMIFTRNQKTKKGPRGSVSVAHLQLFYTEKDANDIWRDPQQLSISDDEYSTGHPSIANNGKILYFSSTIPGGFGGSDIYKSTWENNTWSKPENLGANINSAGNEMFPYIHGDTILYFASDGYKGLGGLDIYKANISSFNGTFNLGYPINSRSDDFSICIYPDGTKGYFASNRGGGKGNDDIYEFTVNIQKTDSLPPSQKIEDVPVTVFYTIQILALRNPKLVDRTFMKKLQSVLRHKGKDGLYRYTYGEYQGAEDAVSMLNSIRAMGYGDAFIRRIETYAELSEAPGENTDLLYERMGRTTR